MAEPVEQARVKANRERVFQAAREVFGEQGPTADIRVIAERAGVGMGTIYRNFGSKDDLIDALVAEVERQMLAIVDAAEAESDPLRAIQLWLRGAWRFAESYGAMARSFRDAGIQGHSDVKPPMLAKTTLLFQQAIDAGAIRVNLTPAFLLTYLRGLLQVYADIRIEVSEEEASRMCTDAFLHGILT
jgi:AcrR family transcriptional regulator